MKKRVIIERLCKLSESGDFVRDFWQKAGHEARFAAAAEMVAEVELIRGNNAREFRLQRTVSTLQRRER